MSSQETDHAWLDRAARYTRRSVKSSVTTLEANKVKLSVEVEESEIDAHIDEAFKKIAKEIRLPGFRPGKAPRKVLEARIGKEYARGEALQSALPEYYRKAIIEHEVDAIAPPDLDVTSGEEAGAVEFEAVVQVRPEVTVAGYNGLRIEIPAPEATDEEIDQQIDQLRDQFAGRVSADRPAIDGDYVTMDITATHDGEDVAGLSADDYTYEVGAGFVVDEIDEELRGAKVGDIIAFDADHPDPDEEDRLEFKILIKTIEVKELPQVDDDFAQEASEFDTADELIADTRTRVETMKRSQVNALIAQRTGDALAELVDADIPEALVEDQVQRQMQDVGMRLAQQGMGLEQFLEMTGQSPQDFAEGMKEPAEQAARVDLALRAIVVAEGMELSDEEFTKELAETAGHLSQDVDELREAFEQGGQLKALRTDLLKQKAMEMLIDSVELVDEDGKAIDRASLEEPDTDESGTEAVEADAVGNTTDPDDVGDTHTEAQGDDS